jgi:hypothetical protein
MRALVRNYCEVAATRSFTAMPLPAGADAMNIAGLDESIRLPQNVLF